MSIDPTATEIVYPESDGKPMADNTLQWDWMVKIVGELRTQFAGQEVFVAGDLFWYPVEGHPEVVTAPDALVVFGRPPGYRGSYQQWEEGGIAPQVVFEVRSRSNTRAEMADKRLFYERHGVEEYYYIDPYRHHVEGWIRANGRLEAEPEMSGFVSPRLGVRFEETDGEVRLYSPDGRMFQHREEREQEILEELRKTALAFEDVRQRAIDAERAADVAVAEATVERERAEAERQRAERALAAAEAERQRAVVERVEKEKFVAKLRALGIDPDDVLRSAG